MAGDIASDELLDMVREFVDEFPEATVADIMAEYDLSDTEVTAVLFALRDVIAHDRQLREAQEGGGDGE